MTNSNRRLLACAFAGTAIAAAAAAFAPWQVAVLAGWCAGAIAFLGQVAREVWNCDAAATKKIATREDVSHFASDVVLTMAASASLVGVGFVLAKAAESSGVNKGGTLTLGALSVALAWATVQTIYTLRYARLYYEADTGIDFAGEAPDYHDFAYIAFGIGMCYQVADTGLTTRPIRRTALRHALLSFLFSTSFIAVLVNVVGGLL